VHRGKKHHQRVALLELQTLTFHWCRLHPEPPIPWRYDARLEEKLTEPKISTKTMDLKVNLCEARL
jgi:hypothetical protein